jgi:hypothetical protein
MHHVHPTLIGHEHNQIEHGIDQIVEVLLRVFPLVTLFQAIRSSLNQWIGPSYLVVAINDAPEEGPFEQVHSKDGIDDDDQ